MSNPEDPKLTVKRNVDISGGSLEVASGSAPVAPQVIRSNLPKPKRKVSGLVGLLILLLLAVALKMGWDFYRYVTTAKGTIAEIDYRGTCINLMDEVFGPLDISAPNPVKEIHSFASLCDKKARSQEPDAVIAAKALQLCNRLIMANSQKENYETVYRSYIYSPPAVLEKGHREEEDKEAKRRTQFYINNLAIEPWKDYVHRERPRCIELLDHIVAGGNSFIRPLGLLQHFRKFIVGYSEPVAKWIPASLFSSEMADDADSTCAACSGRGRVVCSSCAGKGRVAENVSVPCDQCAGTGMYKRRLSKSSVKCPFCRGSGSVSKSSTKSCESCRGMGTVVCGDCNGRGKAPGINQ